MSQLNPGDMEAHTEEELKELFPEEHKMQKLDPYHHRYSRAEVGSTLTSCSKIVLTDVILVLP